MTILVAYHQGSLSLESRICSSGLAGVMHLTVRAMLPNFAFLAVFCPVARASPRGTAGSQCDKKLNTDARDQRGYQGLWIKTWRDGIATEANPGRPHEMADFANFGIVTPRGDPLAPRCLGIWGNQVA